MGFLSKLKETLFGPPTDYDALLKEGAVIVDVRTKQEFQHAHAKKSQNIPLSNLGAKVGALKGKKVILVCKSGGRAGQAKSMLAQNGIEAYNAGPWQTVKSL